MQEGGDLGVEPSAKSAEGRAIAFYYKMLGGIDVAVPVCEGLVGKGMAICKSFLFGGGGTVQAGEERREGHVERQDHSMGQSRVGNKSLS